MTMTLLKSRLERLEKDLRFKEWLSVQRIFDTWTDDELEAYATQGCLPVNPFNRARPLHGSLDGVDRKKFQEAEHQAPAEQKKEKKPEKILPDAIDSLYFDYQIKGGDPTMRPLRVMDDGTKTYIQMPVATERTEAPVLVVEGPDGSEMVNYRVKEDPENNETLTYIVDRLFNRAALVVGAGKHAKKVEITRRVAIGQQTTQSETRPVPTNKGGQL